jgi:hypothetical protein
LTATTLGYASPLPVVTGHDTTVATNAAVPITTLFSAQPGPLSSIQQYLFMDDGSDGGHLTVNGVTMANHTWITVSASQLSSVSHVGGTAAGTEKLYAEAHDAYYYSDIASATATTVVGVVGHAATSALHI